MQTTSVLFLCLGNICRSPLAEGIFRDVVARRGDADRFVIDSAGTGGWHVGEPPDRRSVAVAKKNGIDISGQRSRKLAPDDFVRFDWIVAMDGSNASTAAERRPEGVTARIVEIMDLVPNAREPEVPDPYYGGPNGFDHVYDLLRDAMTPLLDHVDGR